eukprot:1179544-Prorocentrum_minimum.AAC.4
MSPPPSYLSCKRHYERSDRTVAIVAKTSYTGIEYQYAISVRQAVRPTFWNPFPHDTKDRTPVGTRNYRTQAFTLKFSGVPPPGVWRVRPTGPLYPVCRGVCKPCPSGEYELTEDPHAHLTHFNTKCEHLSHVNLGFRTQVLAWEAVRVRTAVRTLLPGGFLPRHFHR